MSNTFLAADAEHPGSADCWTHPWYVDSYMTKQIDFVLCSSACISESRVMYDLNCCSGHKPLVCKASLKLADPVSKNARRVRKKTRSVKGWRPRSQADAADFAKAMSELPHDATVTQIQDHLSTTVPKIPHATLRQRKLQSLPPEPEELSKARLALHGASSPEERHVLSRELYRAKRRWVKRLSEIQFSRSAMHLGRADRTSCAKVQWMFDSEGSRTYDPLVWESEIRKYFTTLYSSSMETADEKRGRLHALENQCLEQHADGTHEWVHLPLHHLFEARHRMAAGKAPGLDGLVYEVFMFLPWQVLDMIWVAFEKRLNSCPGHHEVIQAWQEIPVVHIPKVAAAHKVEQWRPLCMLPVLCKWYSSCVVLFLQHHLPKPTCNLYGFIPGRQTMEISELVRLLLQRFNEWDIPIVIIKSDVGRAFDYGAHSP